MLIYCKFVRLNRPERARLCFVRFGNPFGFVGFSSNIRGISAWTALGNHIQHRTDRATLSSIDFSRWLTFTFIPKKTNTRIAHTSIAFDRECARCENLVTRPSRACFSARGAMAVSSWWIFGTVWYVCKSTSSSRKCMPDDWEDAHTNIYTRREDQEWVGTQKYRDVWGIVLSKALYSAICVGIMEFWRPKIVSNIFG